MNDMNMKGKKSEKRLPEARDFVSDVAGRLHNKRLFFLHRTVVALMRMEEGWLDFESAAPMWGSDRVSRLKGIVDEFIASSDKVTSRIKWTTSSGHRATFFYELDRSVEGGGVEIVGVSIGEEESERFYPTIRELAVKWKVPVNGVLCLSMGEG